MSSADNCSSSEKSVCIILLIGVPGSGKTYLTNFLVDHFTDPTRQSIFTDVSILPVTYDDCIDQHDWKQSRKAVVSSVQHVIHRFNTQSNKIDFNNFQINNSRMLFIVIDDNMYYRSMRYEYWKLAKSCRAGFCQIYLDASLEEALVHNRMRASVVPDEIITRMYGKLEKPRALDNSWERNSVVIKAYSELSFILDAIHNVIRNALLACEQYTQYVENYDYCKVVTDTNVMHQIDLKLRGLIGLQMAEMRQNESFNKNELRCFAKQLNRRRAQLMKEIKSGVVELPGELLEKLSCVDKRVGNVEFINGYLLGLFGVGADCV